MPRAALLAPMLAAPDQVRGCQQPQKKTAKKLGLMCLQVLLAQADEFIE
jgi:hypothetical protein